MAVSCANCGEWTSGFLCAKCKNTNKLESMKQRISDLEEVNETLESALKVATAELAQLNLTEGV